MAIVSVASADSFDDDNQAAYQQQHTQVPYTQPYRSGLYLGNMWRL
jgi:hypothetical protein